MPYPRLTSWLLVLGLAASSTACSSDDTNGGSDSGALPDAGSNDDGASPPDGASGDTGTSDTGAAAGDAGASDATLDASDAGASLGDTGAADAGTADTSTPDTGAGDTGAPDSGAGDAGTGDAGATFAISGTVTYDWVSANDDVTEGGDKLDYSTEMARPVRRASVYGMESGAVLVQTMTKDDGSFTLDVPAGHTVTLRVAAKSVVTSNAPDGIAPDRCSGASWDVKVIDNTQSGAQYVLDSPTPYSASQTAGPLHAALVYSGTAYTDRTAAPFAILDTIVTEIELICEGKANLVLPSLDVNWSVNNIGTSGDPTVGQIGTSHYSRDPNSGQSQLSILGKEDVDTDEYDDHVIAHEFGHFLEDRLFRSDSVGGDHGAGDTLDPRVAFGEGWGNGLSGMVFNDPIYVDTSGPGQASGSSIPVNAAPTGDDRGVYSEASMQYMLWSLFDNRSPGHGTFERIYDVFANYQKTTPALTSGLSFASYYNQVYGGAAEQLQTVWSQGIGTPYNALCAGPCAGTGDTADPFDVDDDIGLAYGADRHYPQMTGSTFAAGFWELYRPLADGANPATAHDVTNFGGYSYSDNKLGAQRWYSYASTTAAPVTIAVSNLGASSCATDVLNMQVLLAGQNVAADESTTGDTAGCPTVQFTTTAGATYVVVVNGFTTQLPSFDITVTR